MKTLYQYWKNIESLSLWRRSLLLFVIALLVRLAIVAALHPYKDLARYELERTAISLATTGVYGNPYAVPSGPTAHVSPGYTLILAGLFRFFGTNISGEIIKELLASVITAISCALLPAISEGMLLGARAGFIAGLICALFPIKPFIQVDGDWEAPYTALFLMLTVVNAVQLWKRGSTTTASAVLSGLLWGCALLFASVLLPVFFAYLVIGAYFCRHAGYRKYLLFAGTQTLIAILCLVPWMIRNERALGAPIATRSNFGIELRVSNNDQATPDQRVNYLLGVYDRYHPLQNPDQARLVSSLGEVRYNRLVQEDAQLWIRQHPGRFLALSLGRFRCFWFYPDPSQLKSLFGDATAVLGLLGFLFVVKQQPIPGLATAAVLLLYPAPNYLVHVGARQRFPIDWLLTLLSVVFVMRSWQLWQKRMTPTTSKITP